jgi:hypothetical protein
MRPAGEVTGVLSDISPASMSSVATGEASRQRARAQGPPRSRSTAPDAG